MYDTFSLCSKSCKTLYINEGYPTVNITVILAIKGTLKLSMGRQKRGTSNLDDGAVDFIEVSFMYRLIHPVFADNEICTTFQIPVIWKMRTIMSVNAHSLKEAIKVVNSHEYQLPEGEYVEDSYEIDYDRLEE